MCSQLNVGFIMEPFDCCVLDRLVHSLNLAVSPRMIGLGKAVLDPVGLADHVEAHWPRMDCIAVPGLLGKLDAP